MNNIIGHFGDESFHSQLALVLTTLTRTTTTQKVALVNSTTDTLKKSRLTTCREDRQEPGLVALYTTSGQETERVYHPRAHMHGAPIHSN